VRTSRRYQGKYAKPTEWRDGPDKILKSSAEELVKAGLANWVTTDDRHPNLWIKWTAKGEAAHKKWLTQYQVFEQVNGDKHIALLVNNTNSDV